MVAERAPGITLGIASEYSWSREYARWGIHIGAKNNQLRDGYSWWTSGVATDSPGRKEDFARYIDRSAETASSFDETYLGWAAGLSNGFLRDVREPTEQIFDWEQSRKEWFRILTWRRMLLHRAATFYGTDSPQYRNLYAYARMDSAKEREARRDVHASDILPKWKHIQSRISLADKPYEDQVLWRSVFGYSREEESEDGAG